MRFRLGINNSGAEQLQQGVSSGLQSLFMLPMLRAQAADQAQRAQAEADLRTAQQRQADAHATLFQTQADAAREQQQRGSVPEMLKTAALMNKVPLSQVGEFSDYAQTGNLAGKYELPASQQGPTLPKPAYADPGVGAQIYRTLGLLQGGLTAGGKIDDIAKAGGELQRQDTVRDVTADPSSAGRVGQAYAAVGGKPLIENVGTSGRSFNRFTGQGGTLDAGMAALFDQGERAQIFQRNSAGQASQASARHSDAGTRKINQEMEQGQRTGNLQVVTSQDGTVTIVDKVNRTAQPVLDAAGRPVVKGSPGGGGKPMTEGQAKANLFGARMLESDKILADLEGKGVTRPGNIKSLATGVASAIPIIGDSLADGAAAATNWTQSPEQQQVEQARRDFVNAVLRRESGAAISASEFDNATKQYFPQPGDSPKVLAQKRRNRQIATTLMLQEVPEAMRYKPGAAAPAPDAPAATQTGGATGSWGTPAAPAGWSIQRVN